MSKGKKSDNYEIGYSKPPKNGQFKKGASGNPSGRPKKPSDFLSALLREANSEVPINENGKPKLVKKIEVVAKQVMNKAATGSIHSQRLLFKLLQQAEERAAEQEQNSSKKRSLDGLTVKELTDEELEWIIRNSPGYAAMTESPEYAALTKKDGKKEDE
jgi:hypothetical protein